MPLTPQHISLDCPKAARFFIEQSLEYSCGPACLATVAHLYGMEKEDPFFFRKLLAPDPEIGIKNSRLVEAAQVYLPFVAAGEDVYEDGIAIANIIDEDEGHYVVFLQREEGHVLYFDPYYYRLVLVREEGIEWRSGFQAKTLERWAITFTPPRTSISIAAWIDTVSEDVPGLVDLPLKIA